MCGSWAVGTIDQALMGVLTSRHNALRLFGLAGKTVIIDEVHACDPYMQGLLLTLLRWLGSLGTPVVLLSATLTRRAARELVTAYLSGARGKASHPAGSGRVFGEYPGWTYVDAVTGDITTVAVSSTPSRRPLTVSVRESKRARCPALGQRGRGARGSAACGAGAAGRVRRMRSGRLHDRE